MTAILLAGPFNLNSNKLTQFLVSVKKFVFILFHVISLLYFCQDLFGEKLLPFCVLLQIDFFLLIFEKIF